MEQQSLKELFQQEFSKIVAVLAKRFGLKHIEIAEDIASETFLAATEAWAQRGIPENPTAWLYVVARQKALYHFRRSKIYEQKVAPRIATELTEADDFSDLDFTREHIRDSQLQVMFAVCDPSIASEAQIGLALRILCGFGIDEIADAFFTNKETINKRLFRAREKLRDGKLQLALTNQREIINRLDSVLHIVYLLFNEGYYSTTQNENLRRDFCFEAMRLGAMLTEYPPTDLPKTNALMALMCFHASRFNARKTHESAMVLYEDQDETRWDKDLIRQGMLFLDRSADGEEITSYHLEARIASYHCVKKDTKEKWDEILRLYDHLLAINFSPSVALNRIFALYKARGRDRALKELEDLRLDDNHFYFILLSELHRNSDQERARQHLEQAYSLARTEPEKNGIQEKIKRLQ